MIAVVAIHAARRVDTRHVDPSSRLYRGGSRYQLIHRNPLSTGRATARVSITELGHGIRSIRVCRYCHPLVTICHLSPATVFHYYLSALRSCLPLLSPHCHRFTTASRIFVDTYIYLSLPLVRVFRGTLDSRLISRIVTLERVTLDVHPRQPPGFRRLTLARTSGHSRSITAYRR